MVRRIRVRAGHYRYFKAGKIVATLHKDSTNWWSGEMLNADGSWGKAYGISCGTLKEAEARLMDKLGGHN